MLQAQEQLFAGAVEASTVLIALGANLASRFGAPQVSVQHAMHRLDAELGTVTGKSRLFRTPCFPTDSGPDYVNAAVSATCRLSPHSLLKILHDIEAEFRRERTQRWGARTLDLDLLAVGEAVLPDMATQETWRHLDSAAQRQATPETLILPHPRLQDRAFVLVPLADVAPDWRHPLTGTTVREMCAALPAQDVAGVIPFAAATHGDSPALDGSLAHRP